LPRSSAARAPSPQRPSPLSKPGQPRPSISPDDSRSSTPTTTHERSTQHGVRQVATERSSDPDNLLDANGAIVADEDHVEAALDLIEGRFFRDPISEEKRRADRLSRRDP
jgi:hypothetical protein